jgi:hypothetical protein
MPKATTSIEDTQRKELKSAPPDGFVVLRRMNYGEVIQRRTMVKLSVESSGGKKDFRGEMAMASREVARFEFANCIVDHNLEDDNGNKLNLANEVDFSRLHPRIGQEIDKYISEMNNFEEDEDLGN